MRFRLGYKSKTLSCKINKNALLVFVMKGISLALETIIVLILAITVLTVLSFFFTKQFGQGQTTIELLNGQREACSAYVRQNSKCTSETHRSVDTSNKDNVLGKLTYYCGRLEGHTDCPNKCRDADPAKCKDKASYNCVIQCCSLYCPAGSKPQEQTIKRPG